MITVQLTTAQSKMKYHTGDLHRTLYIRVDKDRGMRTERQGQGQVYMTPQVWSYKVNL